MLQVLTGGADVSHDCMTCCLMRLLRPFTPHSHARHAFCLHARSLLFCQRTFARSRAFQHGARSRALQHQYWCSLLMDRVLWCSLLMDRVLWCSLLIDCVLSSTVVLVGESKTWLPELVAKARALVVGAGCDASSEVYPLPLLPAFLCPSPSLPSLSRPLMYRSGRTVVVWE